ncbi:MAG: hypothetical protein IPK80_11295 [Nannocystis sp.]|nr:hypothetical protein [Nannocystis sp.]
MPGTTAGRALAPEVGGAALEEAELRAMDLEAGCRVDLRARPQVARGDARVTIARGDPPRTDGAG